MANKTTRTGTAENSFNEAASSVCSGSAEVAPEFESLPCALDTKMSSAAAAAPIADQNQRKKINVDMSDAQAKAIKLIERAQRVVCYVGAGASASSGLGTFRGVGAVNAAQVREEVLDAVYPNETHRAVAALVAAGRIAFVTTSNHDNLVRKAGVADCAELFGNAYNERCLKCNELFCRSTVTPAISRKCEKCQGRVVKTGVRYGQEVPAEPLARAHAERDADVALVLGSGMHTAPFSELPLFAKKVVVVNLGATAVDAHRKVLKVDGDTDSFMAALCAALGVAIPPFTFRQRFRVGWRAGESADEAVVFVEAALTNEAVTFAAECQFADGDAVERVEPHMTRWSFAHTVRRTPARTVRVTLVPKEAYAGAQPVAVDVEIGAQAHESVGEFVHRAQA